MPSDFISLLSADLDLDSPKSLYSKESVYDLLPKELQLPPSRETSVASMSQTSGGEAGSPPPAVVAADASSAPSSSSMGGACSSFTTSSSPTIYSTSVTDSKAMKVESCSSAVGDEGCGLESEQSCSMWMEDSPSNFSNMSTSSYNDNTEVPRKSRKRNPKQRPGIKRRDCEESNMDIFDADSAKAPHYVLSQLSTDSKGNSKAGNGTSENQKGPGGKKTPMLCGQYPTKSEGKELKIVVQPETQHRARYLTEGSRGSVKDRTQQGFPTVKLEGHNESVVLQVFVGNDSGRVKPHGFYQACRVTGRNTTPCKEVDIEGTTVIEVGLDPSNNMTLAVDCVGILKLRNADVEARIGLAGSKKKSTRARLVFRVNIPRKDGSTLTLQTPSSPILCTQPAGVPEILKKSLHSCSVKGEEEVFLIGKNFLKGTKVIFQENISDENSWKAEAEIDMELFHQNHLIVKVPPYHDQHITSAVSVGIYVVTNAGRSHDVQPFTYTPDTPGTLNVIVKEEISSPAQPCSFEEAIKAVNVTGCNLDKVNILPSALITPLMPISMIKSEEVSPMEVTAEKRSPTVFSTTKVVGPTQQSLEKNMSSISTSASHLPSDNENQQQIQPKNMIFNPNQNPIANQEQQGQSIFHPQANMAPMSQDQQPMQFQNQTTVTPLQNPGSTQAESQQPTLFHNSPQIQLVQGSPSSQEQQVTLFISSASMSALQNSMSQQELQQSPIYSSQNSMTGIQGTASPPQQQASLFRNTAGGAINQLQNSPASSQQTSGIFLFGIQNNCGQLLTSGPATLPDQLMAISQSGQPQNEGQPPVPTLLPQQISENSPLPSAMTTNQNMEKIDDLLVSLQNPGNNMAGSF
ncbi:nuclear factor of activated T-cells 5 isoform A [Alligator mississippiensis]|uniref:Nuclear factor of activated T-cells 5 n=1 Tax=Alligator mississippiensis TaxID=8496 RepID=A0A151NNZ5_ALLMI|nr:nuclear factor of activated T-cells 5 isoform A [Alligator mississippiensis]